jgi:hypothetical protein
MRICCLACAASLGRYVILYSVEPNGEALIIRVIPGDRDIPALISG